MGINELELPSIEDITQQTAAMRKRLEALGEATRLQAKLLRVAFNALIEEGFTADQAVEIIKARGGHLIGE